MKARVPFYASRPPWPLHRVAVSMSARSAVVGLSDSRIPFLLVLTFLRAIPSCSSIWFCRCFSRFCNMSSCERSPRMAFLGLSLRLCAAAPPNQPHMLAVLWEKFKLWEGLCQERGTESLLLPKPKLFVCKSLRENGVTRPRDRLRWWGQAE